MFGFGVYCYLVFVVDYVQCIECDVFQGFGGGRFDWIVVQCGEMEYGISIFGGKMLLYGVVGKVDKIQMLFQVVDQLVLFLVFVWWFV